MSNEITLFNFVSDERFRKILESDYQEVQRCNSADCTKSAIVLSGSIIECLSLYAITDLALWPANKGDLLKADLGALITCLHGSDIISEKTRDLSSVIRHYRNLVHPGKMIRLEEQIDKNSAIIAAALVNIISNEIESAFVKRHGLTAEQFAHKLRIDPFAANIAQHHLTKMSGPEMIKLITRIIPEEMVKMENEYIRSDDIRYTERFGRALERVFMTLCANVGAVDAFAKLYVDTVRNGSEEVINVFDKKFMCGQIIRQLNDDDRRLILDHWKSRVEQGQSAQYSGALKSFLCEIDYNELATFIYKMKHNHFARRGPVGKDDAVVRDIMAEVVVWWPEKESAKFLDIVRNRFGYSDEIIKFFEKLVLDPDDIPF